MVGMYDLSKVFLLCVREMKEAGIPVQEGRVYRGMPLAMQ